MRHAVILALIVVPPGFAADKPVAETWKLKLAPEKLPELPDSLYGRTWSRLGLRSRTGAGFDDHFTFRKAEGAKPAQLEWKQVVNPRFGTPKKETTRTLDVRRVGPLLEFDGQVRTAVIHEGELVLNAAIPFGEKSWYVVYSDRFTNGDVRVSEWRFEFQDDPRQESKGKLNVKHHSNVFPMGRTMDFDLPATFELKKAHAERREVYVRHDNAAGKGRYRLQDMIFWTGKPFAEVEDSEARWQVFK